MSRPMRFLHAADIHLGTPVQGFSGAAKHVEAKLREASFLAWERICDAALAYEVDFVLVAGDLYHREARTVQAARFLRSQVQRLAEAGIMVYVVNGNHDPVGKREELVDMPDNFYAFPAAGPECMEVRDKGGTLLARIFGVSYRSRWDSRPLHAMLQPPDATMVNIGLLHTALDPANPNYSPCSIQDLIDQKHIHYWALGHVHNPRILRSELPAIAYPGTPQGRHPGEGGIGGCLLVELTLGKAPDIRFVPIAPLVWKEMEISIEESDGDAAIANISDVERLLQTRAEELLEESGLCLPVPTIPMVDSPWRPEGYLIRWVLTGRGPVHDQLTDSENGAVDLERCLEGFQYREPFLWTESIQIQTGKVLPEWESMLESWPLAEKLEAIAADCLSEEAIQAELTKALGRIWEVGHDPEHPKEDTLPATEQTLATILGRAKRLAYEELLKGGQMP